MSYVIVYENCNMHVASYKAAIPKISKLMKEQCDMYSSIVSPETKTLLRRKQGPMVEWQSDCLANG